MFRGNYGYVNFKQKQHMDSVVRKARLEFNKEFDKLLSDCYDQYLDFIFNLYSEFYRGTDEEESVFEKVYNSISTEAYEKSKEFIESFIDSISSEEKTSIDKECLEEVIKEVFSIYYNHIDAHYLFLGHEYLSSCLKKSLEDLKEKECVCKLMILDSTFVKVSFHKINFLFNKVRESSEYASNIFSEEVTPNLMYRLKDRIIKNTLNILEELYEVVVNELDFDICEFIEDNNEEESSYQGGKLDYIDDYKKLNKLATDNGFNYVRCKGDHGIFKNGNGLVVIPQGRTVGKGLSFKIQKAIFSLSSESA